MKALGRKSNDDTLVVITPLGAAIVEAMPDKAKMKQIEREWKDYGRCPTSDLFPTPEDIYDFYHSDD